MFGSFLKFNLLMKNKNRILQQCLIIMSFLAMVSCGSTYNGKRFNYSYTNEANAWIESYKYQVFNSCLKEGMQNDTIFKMMDKKDFFDFNEDVNLNTRANASKLGKNIIKNLPNAIIPKCSPRGLLHRRFP